MLPFEVECLQKQDRHFTLFFVVLLLFGAIAAGPVVFATNIESVNIPPSSEKLLTVNLTQGDNFRGSISVSGGCSSAVNFWVTNPEGSTILNMGQIKQGTTFEFTAQDSGAYIMHFDNSFSLFSTKAATLSYDISHAIFDIGVISILVTLIIVVVIVALVVVLLRRQNKQANDQ